MIFGYNLEKIRWDFPILGKGIIYFDNACMSLKPKQVIDKINEYYVQYPACGGRSIHHLAEKVSDEVRAARNEIAKLVNAKKDSEIIFTRNTTEGINIVANGIGLQNGDEIIISDKEHNSNLIPWLKQKGIKIIVAESKPDNTFDIEAFKKSFNEKTKLVSIVHRSNLDGVTNPIQKICTIAHKHNVQVLVDGAQSTPGMEIDVRSLDIDYFSFSGHKMLGPSGTGVLYGKQALLEKLNPLIAGGDTVKDSHYDSFIPEDVPMRFEAGLQDYAGIIGLGEASRYLRKIGFSAIAKHEIKLNKIITEGLANESKIKLIGPKNPELRAGIYSFNINGMDPHHVCKILVVSKKILVRSGAHCVHSWFNKHNIKGSVSVSLYLYNTEQE